MLTEQITRERLEAEFGNDPLFDAIERMNLMDELFDQETLSVLVERHEYTTTEFEKWFCVNEADERYLSTPGIMRTFIKELSSYLQTRNIGRAIIMDYQGVIKLKMALLLRKNGMKPALIYETAGTKAYSPSVIQRGQGPVHTQSPAMTKSSKDLLYEQLMESLLTQLTAAGAITQLDGKIQVDLRVLLEKQIELMAPSLLPAGMEQAQQKLDQIDSEISQLKHHGAEARDVVDEIKKKYEEELPKVHEIKQGVSELKEQLRSEQAEIKKTQDLKNECRNKAFSFYKKIKEATTISEKEELASQLRKLEEEYTDFEYIIRDYGDKVDELIVKLKLEEKEQKTQQIKEECLRLFQVLVDTTSTKSEVDDAKNQLMKLQETHRDLAFEIRSFLASAQQAAEKSKEKGTGGFLSWFKRNR